MIGKPATTIAGVIASATGFSAKPRIAPARILVALMVPFGDLLCARPAVAALRRAYPEARLTALVPRTRADLIASLPEIDDHIVYDDTPEWDAIARLDATLRVLGPRRFDLYVSMNTGGNALGMVTGIPRQAWQRLPFFFWFWGAHFNPAYRARHAVEHYWQVVAPLEIFPRSPADLIPTWDVPASDQRAARARYTAMGIPDDRVRPVICLHPGAAGYRGRKRWPATHFAALAQHLIATLGAWVIILGGPQDQEAAQMIRAAGAGRAWSMAGELTMRESIAIAAQADCYVGCDTGLTHYAVALRVPTVALFGVTNLANFAPRPADPTRLQLILPTPLPLPIGSFIGAERAFWPARPHLADPMGSITVERVATAVAALGAMPRL